MINDTIKGTVCELEVKHNGYDRNKERIFEDGVTSLPNETYFNIFCLLLKNEGSILWLKNQMAIFFSKG